MKTNFLLLILFLVGLYTRAQDTQIIHAGDNFSDYFTYRFPSFSDASILLKNKTVTAAKMNFNTLLCKMQFIDSSGDTLVLSKPEEIDSIRMNGRSFFYNKGYFEIIAESDSVKLTVLRKIYIDVVVTGALGMASHTANVGSFDSYLTTAGPKSLQLKNDLEVKKETVYSLFAQNGVVVGASKSGFLKIFSNDKKRIENFLKSNKINFNSETDLEKLFLFCVHPSGNLTSSR